MVGLILELRQTWREEKGEKGRLIRVAGGVMDKKGSGGKKKKRRRRRQEPRGYAFSTRPQGWSTERKFSNSGGPSMSMWRKVPEEEVGKDLGLWT